MHFFLVFGDAFAPVHIPAPAPAPVDAHFPAPNAEMFAPCLPTPARVSFTISAVAIAVDFGGEIVISA